MLTPFILDYCKNFKDDSIKRLNILEIGVDHGQTMVPILHGLISDGLAFNYDAVDIMHHSGLDTILRTMHLDPNTQVISFIKINSLKILPLMAKGGHRPRDRDRWGPYDIILIDGDHNYVTVYNELVLCMLLSHTNTVYVLDDYGTRHGAADCFYVDRPGYADIDATPHGELVPPEGRSGVRHAVNDFVSENPSWHILHPMIDEVTPCDFALLVHEDHLISEQMMHPEFMPKMIDICRGKLAQYDFYYLEKEG